MSDDPVTYLDASSAAKQVGVSTSGLRRLAPIYEQVHGELPRAGKGSGDSPRLWSPDAVSRLKAARSAVEAGRFKSVLTALEALQGSETTGEGLAAAQTGSELTDRQLLEALVAEVKSLRTEVESLRASDRALPQTVEVDKAVVEDRPGLLVRVAMGIDRWLNRL